MARASDDRAFVIFDGLRLVLTRAEAIWLVSELADTAGELV